MIAAKKPAAVLISILASILAGIYPPLFYASNNAAQIIPDDFYRSLIFSGAFALILLLLFWLCSKKRNSAVIASILVTLALFSYGQIYQFARGHFPFLAHHSVMLPLLSICIGLILYLSFRKADLNPASVLYSLILILVLNSISAIPLLQEFGKKSELPGDTTQNSVVAEGKVKPNYYFLILDGYARTDVLRDFYQFDNSEFLNDLQTLGFWVNDCSQSNYSHTIQSFASSLNLDYLTDLPITSDLVTYKTRLRAIRQSIIHSKMRQSLESAGYRTIATETGYGFTELTDASKYLTAPASWFTLNHFENNFLNTTVFLAIRDAMVKFQPGSSRRVNSVDEEQSSPGYFYRVHKNALDFLDTLGSTSDANFYFIHITAPHPPYVFSRNGQFVTHSSNDPSGFVDQTIYLNHRVLNSISKILKEDQSSPVIYLASDHGDRNLKETAVKNLMAIYAPDDVVAKFYNGMTPINAQRVLVNYLLGTSYPQLPDKSYYSVHFGEPTMETIPGSCPK